MTRSDGENDRKLCQLCISREDLIAALLRSKRWTQAEAARRCGVSQPRINDLLRGRVSRFSLDALVNLAAALDRRVEVKLKAA